MTFEFTGDLDQLIGGKWRQIPLSHKRIRYREAADNGGGRRSQPTRVRNSVAAVHFQTGRFCARGRQPPANRNCHQVIRAAGNLPFTFSLDIDNGCA